MKGLSHSSSLGSTSESCGVRVPITEENESSDESFGGVSIVVCRHFAPV